MAVEAGNFTWKQTVEEVTISIALPPGTRGKDVACTIENKRISVKLRNASVPLLEGELCLPVKASESSWSIEDKKLLVIVLQKLKRHDSWSCVVLGQQAGAADDATLEKMKKQMMLEKFQNEVNLVLWGGPCFLLVSRALADIIRRTEPGL